jgi:exopolyphosphatase/guanosine-5'-triphosphate,3'-diphosphate pyrophosphatase
MAEDSSLVLSHPAQAAFAGSNTDRYAVIDIGSNSIRLVVFDGIRRTPSALFNEKIFCGLGRSIHSTGRLDPDGITQALANLQRFAELVEAMGISQVETVATAAVREAEDGPDFVRTVKNLCGLDVRVLTGPEEAELSGLGVLAGLPEADGVMGDLGGGSLELVRLKKGTVRDHVTLPLGPLRLAAECGNDKRRARDITDKLLGELKWLGQARGTALYPVGGSWRGLARVHMAQHNYPLRVIHRYRLRLDEITDLVSLVASQSRESVARLEGVSRRRVDLLPLGALVMSRLLKILAPKVVEFSAYGLREGMVFAQMSPNDRAEDPLISACREIGARVSRFPEHAAELVDWTEPIFSDEPKEESRLRHAACLLSDVAWRAHPNYRAEHAFREVLRNPGFHVDHAGRAYLALALHARHTSGEPGRAVRDILGLIDDQAAKRARAVGLAARLGETISAGVPGLIDRFALKMHRRRGLLRLIHESRDKRLVGEVVVKRFEVLARALDLEPEIVERDD